MEQKRGLFGTERKSTDKPVVLYNESDGSFSYVKEFKGDALIPGLPKPGVGKSLVLQAGEKFYVPTDPFEKAKGPLSKKALEAQFRSDTDLKPQDAIIVSSIPSGIAIGSNYDIKTMKQIRQDRDDLVRGIR